MEKFIFENLVSIITVIISLFSLFISLRSFSLSNRNFRLASYSMRGNYSISFRRETWKERLLNIPSFTLKIFNSISSDTIRFHYKIQITPITGGVSRVQLFNAIENFDFIGIDRTGPVIRNKVRLKSKFPKAYAYESLHGFNSSPLYCYFTVSYRRCGEQKCIDRKLNRYHRYLEVTDFNGNTELWYFSFSLYLSNLDEDYEFRDGWKKGRNFNYKYYKVSEIIIFSPKDLIKNLKLSLMHNKTLEEIRGCDKEWQSSERLAIEGFLLFDHELQAYELREYLKYLKMLKEHV